MVKLVCLLKRKQGLTFEEFKDYYETSHAPLAIGYLAKAVDYQRRYLDPAMPGYLEGGEEMPGVYDCITEVWFESRADMEDNLAVLADSESAKVVIEDEERFLDRDQMRFFVVEDECRLPTGS